MKEFNEGVAAYNNGKSLSDNPYQDRQRRIDWETGWLQAQVNDPSYTLREEVIRHG